LKQQVEDKNFSNRNKQPFLQTPATVQNRFSFVMKLSALMSRVRLLSASCALKDGATCENEVKPCFANVALGNLRNY